MKEKVCRACFALLKTKHYVMLDDKTDIPGCKTVKDALVEILPHLNYEVVIEPALCISCLMVIKTTVKFKHTCLNNEKKLLQYLEDMEATKIDLKRVVDREELTEVISSEHDYIRKYKTSRNLLTEEIKASENKGEDLIVECDGARNDETLEFDVTDSIETYTQFSSDILNLFWNEATELPVKVEINDENVEQETANEEVEDLNCILNKQNENSDFGLLSTDSGTNEEKKMLDTFTEQPQFEFLEANIEIAENNDDTNVVSDKHNILKEENGGDVVILTCTICTVKCEGYKRAGIHAKTKHDCDRIICCKLCKKIFYTSRAYHVHNTIHGFKVGDVQARLPKKPVKKREPKKHLDFFRLCALCGLTFTRPVIFKNHMRRHKEGTPIECDLCMKPFYTTKQVKRHKIKHCLKNRTMDCKEFLCDFCGKHFDQYNKFYNHKKHHVKEGEFKCGQCDKIFTQRMKLKVHMRSHDTERRYMCDLCGHLSKYPEGMRKHRKKHFSAPVKVIRHRCPVCNKGFENLSRMKAHVVIHSNLQPYQCEICERRFNLLNNLKRHMLVHTGEKPYVCIFCNRGFTQSGALKLHQTSTSCRERMEAINANETITDNNNFECNLCGRRFKLLYWLKVHQEKHEQQDIDHTCDVCGSTFANKGNLRRHLMCHTGEKPFQCEVCDKSFRQKTELVVHMRRHTGEKPYKCEVCKRGFVDLSEHRRHLKKHLREVPGDENVEEKVPVVLTFD